MIGMVSPQPAPADPSLDPRALALDVLRQARRDNYRFGRPGERGHAPAIIRDARDRARMAAVADLRGDFSTSNVDRALAWALAELVLGGIYDRHIAAYRARWAAGRVR